jgi:hypothetical protein
MLHLSLGIVAAGRTTRKALTRFLRFFVRTSRPSSRNSRYTSLWLTFHPSRRSGVNPSR